MLDQSNQYAGSSGYLHLACTTAVKRPLSLYSAIPFKTLPSYFTNVVVINSFRTCNTGVIEWRSFTIGLTNATVLIVITCGIVSVKTHKVVHCAIVVTRNNFLDPDTNRIRHFTLSDFKIRNGTNPVV